MGSLIHLALGNLEVDWGKNNAFIDHSALFQPGDVQPISYRYANDGGEPFVEMKDGYARPLGSVVRRLELLGHTLDAVRSEYATLLDEHEIDPALLPFERFAEALCRVDVTATSPDYDEHHDFGEFFGREVYERLAIEFASGEPHIARIGLDEMMENFHPWSVLRLLAARPENLALLVTWSFADVVKGGWVERGAVTAELAPELRLLLVTEGSSDAHVLGKALALLRPDVADFFRFVDMQEGYPFSGTGNLHRFCQGLVSIGVLNRVLVIYDNDTEGAARHAATARLNMPINMRAMRLPDLDRFRSFHTLGPDGPNRGDINGRAAAIECYLDLAWKAPNPPCVRWNNYSAEAGRYHGELVGKSGYTARFLALRGRETGYDFGGIEAVLDAIMNECVAIAGQVRASQR